MNANLGFDPKAGYQQFMNLLVAQIQYQDPLNPVDQQQVTAQLAQISTVQGIGELNVKFSEMLKFQTLFDGAKLLGSDVEYVSPAAGELRQGVISEVRASNGSYVLNVNGEQISLGDVQAVLNGQAPS